MLSDPPRPGASAGGVLPEALPLADLAGELAARLDQSLRDQQPPARDEEDEELEPGGSR